MRNLRIVSLQETTVAGNLPLAATAWDSSNDSIICAYGPTPTNPIIKLSRDTSHHNPYINEDGIASTTAQVPITSWDAPSPLPDLDSDEIILIKYFPDTLTVCLVMAGGDLIIVREEPETDQESIEIVGSVDVGIVAAAWAPDEELLAIVTRSDNLILMSRGLEPVTEATMTTEDLQASKHVSVGWGKKETQFQGKRAKAMRDPTMPEHVDEGIPSPCEHGKVTISWRGDGAYLAINAFVTGHRRVIRVYSREAVLDSVSEPVDGLESALSWRPLGNLIASIKRSKEGADTKLEVIFFERNGLRHGEFRLRLSSAEADNFGKAVDLAWNLDSTVLAVSYAGFVQFWTMGNYHYYLKQEIQVTTSKTTGIAANPTNVVWHSEKPLKCCANSSESLVGLEFQSHVNRGSTITPDDYGIIAVIDGKNLKLTPLRHAGVPPPMSFCELESGSNIIDVAISKSGDRLAILHAAGIDFYEWKLRRVGGTGETGELRHSTDFEKHNTVWSDFRTVTNLSTALSCTHRTQIVFQGDTDVFVLAPTQEAVQSQCFHVRLPVELISEKGLGEISSSTSVIDIPPDTRSLTTDSHQETVWAQTTESSICIAKMDGIETPELPPLHGGQASSMMFQLRPSNDDIFMNGVTPVFHEVSLTAKGTLLADHRSLARDCTSFILTESYLIFTTAQHLLKFVHLTHPDSMEVPGDTPEVDERCRSVERGAKIVTAIPSIYAVVLQMPRGNLETIYPRVLVLTGIRGSLRDLKYRTAFLACQNHQVDMNILHDYLPEIFLKNVRKFINDLKKPVRVDEFLSKLKEEDVTQTLYKDTLKAAVDEPETTVNGIIHNTSLGRNSTSNKVNAICGAFISILEDKPGKFLQCIITAHVCKHPPDLPAALTLVSSLRQTSQEEADLAVSHLCFLTDTNRLFDAALALYDLELTLLVAQNAQRDPREYMPFLQNLQSLPTLRRKFQIDDHLHNHGKALISLHGLASHDEVEAYAIKHALYTQAMDLYRYESNHLTRITTLYAEHLASQSKHTPAATLYESLGLYSEAYPLYALGHQWRESLTCATLASLPSSQVQDLAISLATTCADESRDYRSAATIHTEYLSDPSTAARLLCKGSYFSEASRLLVHHKLAYEIPTTIETGLNDKFGEILDLVADCKSQLTAQVPRIHELRVKKAEDPLAFFGGDAAAAAADGIDIPDNISLAATDATTAGGQSLFTRYGGSQGAGTRFGGTVASSASRRSTSKTKRREERKRARGKKGSVYEEEYLVGSVVRLIEKVNSVHEEVGRLVAGLLRRGAREQAAKVGEVMTEIIAACEKAKSEVWGVEEKTVDEGEKTEAEDGQWRPSGADGVFWESQQGSAKKEAPLVKEWKVNVLL